MMGNVGMRALKSPELDDVIKIHGCDLAILARAVKGLFDLVLRLPLLVLGELLVILTHAIGLQKLLYVD